MLCNGATPGLAIKKAEEEHFDLKEAGRVEPRPGAKGKEVQRVGIT